MPEQIPDTPENIARAIMQGPPKKDWQFMKPGSGAKIDWRAASVNFIGQGNHLLADHPDGDVCIYCNCHFCSSARLTRYQETQIFIDRNYVPRRGFVRK